MKKNDTTGMLIQTMQAAVTLLWMNDNEFCEWAAREHGVVITREQVNGYRNGTVSVMLSLAVNDAIVSDNMIEFKGV